MAVHGSTAPEHGTIAVVRELCQALESEGVGYCHWKSNAFLDRSRTAQNDLDLLVRRADAELFTAIAHRLSFKQAENPARSLPGVSNYYGYDRAADRFVHIHAHYQLIVGDDLTKNYRLPLENAFLDNAVLDGEFRVPPRELELIALVIRLTLKHSTWDALVTRRAKISARAREEVAFLRARVDDEVLYRLLQEHLPFVAPQSFAACMRSLEGTSAARARVRAGQRLAAELAGCARRSRAADVRLKLWRQAAGTARGALKRRPARKRFVAGGALVAVVGGDGAGKSTVVEGLSNWLSKNFAVTKVHLGKPRRSLTTVAVEAVATPSLAALALAGRRAPPSSRVRMVVTVARARDRYIAYRNARRIATNGGLVICDRFPLPQISLMDAPRVRRAVAPGVQNGIVPRLAALEERYYRALTAADVLIVLRVDPEIAVARKPEEAPEFVRARWREIWDVDWDAVPAHVVDASRSAAEVLSDAKALVWSEL
jgi:thymidylate kinase